MSENKERGIQTFPINAKRKDFYDWRCGVCAWQNYTTYPTEPCRQCGKETYDTTTWYDDEPAFMKKDNKCQSQS